MISTWIGARGQTWRGQQKKSESHPGSSPENKRHSVQNKCFKIKLSLLVRDWYGAEQELWVVGLFSNLKFIPFLIKVFFWKHANSVLVFTVKALLNWSALFINKFYRGF